MLTNRRDFLRLSSATLLACGVHVPGFLARSASALAGAPQRASGRVLVVLQLDGGNDGLNTVVPHADDAYRRHRPRLALPAAGLHRLDDRVGLHPALADLRRLLDNQQLAVIQSVGYPNPNRSHFESMAVWHTGRLQPAREAPGWLARYLDRRFAASGGDSPALHIDTNLLPQALQGCRRQVPSLARLEEFHRRLGIPQSADAAAQRAALDQIAGSARGAPGSLLQFVERCSLITYTSSARLERVIGSATTATGYPQEYDLARRLQLIAQLIRAGLHTSIYYTQLNGFDTHTSQLGTHAALLREVGASLRAFLEDLGRGGDAGRVLVLVFSEFGRRLRENASAGTDHGTAGPVFLLGPAVRPGLHGPYPNLQDLDEGGDPRHAIDFRRIYAAVLDQWLGCPAATVLGERFAHVPVLRR
jgi:uncharacterized protein (DUF1501 family)